MSENKKGIIRTIDLGFKIKEEDIDDFTEYVQDYFKNHDGKVLSWRLASL